MVWCRVFSLSLKGETLDWFHSLEPGTIDGFDTLPRTEGLTYLAFVKIRQGRKETLKYFMDHFNRTVRQVKDVGRKFILSSLTTALKPGLFVDSLYAEQSQTLGELQNRATKFI